MSLRFEMKPGLHPARIFCVQFCCNHVLCEILVSRKVLSCAPWFVRNPNYPIVFSSVASSSVGWHRGQSTQAWAESKSTGGEAILSCRIHADLIGGNPMTHIGPFCSTTKQIVGTNRCEPKTIPIVNYTNCEPKTLRNK